MTHTSLPSEPGKGEGIYGGKKRVRTLCCPSAKFHPVKILLNVKKDKEGGLRITKKDFPVDRKRRDEKSGKRGGD